MTGLSQRVWQEGLLWHWNVVTEWGERLTHGASTDILVSRAEALCKAIGPTAAEALFAAEHERLARLKKLSHALWLTSKREAARDRKRLRDLGFSSSDNHEQIDRAKRAILESRELLLTVSVPNAEIRLGLGRMEPIHARSSGDDPMDR
jgi:hypothetical protein